MNHQNQVNLTTAEEMDGTELDFFKERQVKLCAGTDGPPVRTNTAAAVVMMGTGFDLAKEKRQFKPCAGADDPPACPSTESSSAMGTGSDVI